MGITRISEEGRDFIAEHEGSKIEDGFHVPYNDPAGNATVGYGHLLHKGPLTEADKKEVWTEADVRILLRDDLATAFIDIRWAIKNEVFVLLKQHEIDALGSWFFNLGLNAATMQSALVSLLHSPAYWRGRSSNREWPNHAIREEFSKWVYASGKVLPGLVKRRADEGWLFTKGEYR